MRRRVLFLCIVFFLITFAVCSLAWLSPVNRTDRFSKEVLIPEGLQQTINGLPDIDSFSSSEYEDYQHIFPPIDYALLYRDGVEVEIKSDDPRLFCLLNFLANSENESLSAWRQGYVGETEIEEYLNSQYPMLEIYFSDDKRENDDGVFSTTKILICGHSYLIFVDTARGSWTLGEGMYAEQCFPYMALLEPMIDSGAIEKEVLYHNEWGDQSWIDLLVYAGFSEVKN